MPSITANERFDKQWEPEPMSGCWLWVGHVSDRGYARFRVNGTRVGAHRFSYERWVGPITSGLVVDHLCNNPSCVNPDHLQAVSQRANVRRGRGTSGVNSRKRECIRGHAFDEDNTYVDPGGGRHCKECRRAAGRRYYWSNRTLRCPSEITNLDRVTIYPEVSGD